MESIPSSNEKIDNTKNTTNNPSEKDNNKQKIQKNTSTQSQESKFLLDSIQKLKNGDDMDIMAQLINLSEYLSLSSDQIADNPNMGPLLEEICKNLEKTYLSDLIIYSLQCINYILDINPAFTSTLKKVNAVSKIIILMTVMEDFSCLDSIIKIIEKISFENNYILIENNAFISLLNIIDFLGEAQRKSVMKACLNMVMNISSVRVFKSYIQPSLEILASLTKFNENDIQTTNTAILIFYYIVNNMSINSCFKTNPEIIGEIGKYCFIENCCEILKRYLVESQNEKKIRNDLIKRIFKIFEYLCNISGDFLDKIIDNNILNILVDMISNEFNSNNEQSMKSSLSFLTEIFSLLISFFPSYKKDSNEEVKKEKILSEKNMNNYKFLCQNIVQRLINNIMAKSACSTLSNLVKFLQIFTYSAERNVINNFVDSKPLSQIVSKLLDTKYLPYLSDLIELLNNLMKKSPEHFIVNFLREGIVENIKNFKYVGSNESIVYNNLVSPFLNKLLDLGLVPEWVAPNLLTVLSLIFNLIGFLFVIIEAGNDFSCKISCMTTLVITITHYLYIIFDNLDGKQARKTKTSSSFGMLLDHGCDVFTNMCVLLNVSHLCRLGNESIFVDFLIYTLYLGFFTTIYEEYLLGEIHLGIINGPDEGNFFFIATGSLSKFFFRK